MLPSAPAFVATRDGIIVTLATPDDLDLAGYKAWIGTSSTVALDDPHERFDGQSSSFTIPLSDDSNYWLVVAPYDQFGFDPASAWPAIEVSRLANAGIDQQPPGVPTGLAITTALAADGTVDATFSWTANTEEDLSGYDLWAANNGGNLIPLAQVAAPGSSYVVHGLQPNQSIQAELRSYDKSSNYSGFCAVVSATTIRDTTPPGPPANMAANPGINSVYLTASAPSDADVSFLRFYVSATDDFKTAQGIGIANAVPSRTVGRTANQATGTSSYYWATAFDTSGNESLPSGVAQATTYSLTAADFTPGLSPTLSVPNFASLPASNGSGRLAYVENETKTYTDSPTGWTKALDGADLKVGSIQTAAIATDAITASKIGVLGASLFPDGQCQDAAWWTSNPTGLGGGYQYVPGFTGASWYIDTNASPAVVNAKGSLNAWVTTGALAGATANNIQLVPPFVGGIIPVEYYEFKATLYNSSNRPNLSMIVQWFDASGSYITGTGVVCANDSTSRQMSFQSQAPTGAAMYRLYWDANGSTVGFAGQCYIGGITVRQANAGTMIVDGTIVASKVAGKQFTADQIVTGSLSGDLFQTTTSLPASLSISNTGATLGTVQAITAAGSAGQNCVTYSDFPAGTGGWYVSYNPANIFTGGWNAGAVNGQIDGSKPYVYWQFKATNTFSADGNQQVSISTNKFAVIGGSHVWAGAYYQGDACDIACIVWFYRSDGSSSTINGGTGVQQWTYGEADFPAAGGNWETCRRGSFIDIPSDAAFARMEFYAHARVADGNIHTAYLANPMLVICTPGQSIAPAYSAGPNPDTAALINANTTTINPGKVLISGATTLANWRSGADATKIEGGSIAANTITANKLTIGNRALNFPGLSFQVVNGGGSIQWPACYAQWQDVNGNVAQVSISGATQTLGNAFWYFCWTEGATGIFSTTDPGVANRADVVCLCTWYCPGFMLVQNYGGTILDGSQITTGTVTANQIAAYTIQGINIAGSAITGDKIQANTINANSIVAGTIRADRFVTNAGVDLAAIVPGQFNWITSGSQAVNVTLAQGGFSGPYAGTAIEVVQGHRLTGYITGSYRGTASGTDPHSQDYYYSNGNAYLAYNNGSGWNYANIGTFHSTGTTTVNFNQSFQFIAPTSGNVQFGIGLGTENDSDTAATSGVFSGNAYLYIEGAFFK